MEVKEILMEAIQKTRVKGVGLLHESRIEGKIVCAYLLGSRYVGMNLPTSDYDFIVVTSPTEEELYKGTRTEFRGKAYFDDFTAEVQYIDIRTYVDWILKSKLQAQQMLYVELNDVFFIPEGRYVSKKTADLAVFVAYLTTNRDQFALLSPVTLMGELKGQLYSQLDTYHRAEDHGQFERSTKHLVEAVYLGQIASSVLNGTGLSKVIKFNSEQQETYKKLRESSTASERSDLLWLVQDAYSKADSFTLTRLKTKQPEDYKERCKALEKSVRDIILGSEKQVWQ